MTGQIPWSRLLFLCCLFYPLHQRHSVVGGTVQNMFEYLSSPAYLGSAWGKYCYSKSEYIPLCGWTILLTSSTPLTDITVYTATKTKIDDYTFHLQPRSYNRDITLYHSNCDSVGLLGPFGSDAPEVAMSFYCVCTVGTDCDTVPYLTLEEDTTPALISTAAMPSAPPPVTMATAAVLPVSDTVTTATTSLPTWRYASNSTRLRLLKVKDKCYSGSAVMASMSRRLESCGAACLTHASCIGMNFMAAASVQCNLVLADSWDNSDFSSISGCECWKVVERV